MHYKRIIKSQQKVIGVLFLGRQKLNLKTIICISLMKYPTRYRGSTRSASTRSREGDS